MDRPTLLAIAAALTLSSCTTYRVSGFVTDKTTGDGIDTCGIVLGTSYVLTDPAGHYSIRGDLYEHKQEMSVTAPGYQPVKVPVDASKTRYPVVNIELTPKNARPVAKTEETRP